MSVPYIAMYPGDFLADTGHLGNTELGIYWRLLLVYYRDGRPLPFDTDRLRRLAMTFSPEEFRILESVVAEFFVLTTNPDGSRCWRHKRADQELARATNARDKKSAAARATNAKRWGSASLSDSPSDSHSVSLSDVAKRPMSDGESEPESEPDKGEIESNSKVVGDRSAAQRKRSATGTGTRGTRLPQDWQLPKSLGDWAVAELGMSPAAVRTEAAKFRDYWHAKAGKDATKADWSATWRVWCRKAIEQQPASRPASRPAAAPAKTDAERNAEVRRLLGIGAMGMDVIEGDGYAR